MSENRQVFMNHFSSIVSPQSSGPTSINYQVELVNRLRPIGFVFVSNLNRLRISQSEPDPFMKWIGKGYGQLVNKVDRIGLFM